MTVCLRLRTVDEIDTRTRPQRNNNGKLQKERIIMALITTTGVKVTLDETSGLQNAIATSTPAGDADDNDTSLTLPSYPNPARSHFLALGSQALQSAAEPTLLSG